MSKPWKCPSGHGLGLVTHGQRGDELLLYRQAVDLEAEEPAEVDVIALVVGQVMDVRCSICERTRTWVPGEEHMQRIIDSFERRKAERERAS